MRINSKDKFLGQSILKLRELLKYTGGRSWEDKAIRRVIKNILEVDDSVAEIILSGLSSEGYIEKTNIGDRNVWVNTIKGNSLSMASAAKPISRKTANKIYNEFLERVKQVNENEYYLFRIKKVVVFGSFLESEEQLGDIDIAVEIVPKEEDKEKHFKLTRERAREASNQGRRFGNYVEELFWAREEVKRFLKSRARSISLHETDDKILEQVDFCIVYQES